MTVRTLLSSKAVAETHTTTLAGITRSRSAARFTEATSQAFPDWLATLFDPAPLGVTVTNRQGFIVYVNPRQCENSALSREALVGLHRRTEFGPSLEKAGILALSCGLEDDGTPFEITLPRFRRQSDGAVVAFSLRGFRYGDYNLFFTIIDATLAEQVSRYEQLFENASDGIFILSRDGRFVAANQEITRMVGIPREELIGQTTEVLLPGRLAQSLERVERIIREGRLGPYELEIETRLGKKVISLNGFAMTEMGVPVGVMNIARDVTERKLAERAFERQSSLVKLLKDVAVASNQASTIEAALRTAVERVCGFTQWPVGHVYALDPRTRELVPTQIWHLAAAERFASFRHVTEATRLAPGVGLPGRVLATAQPAWIVDVTKDGTFLRAGAARECGLKAGFAFPLLVGPEVVAILEFFSGETLEPDAPLLDLMGNIGTQLGRVMERERAAAELAAARDQALESAQLKSSFLASMSHEIRTPLNGVIGMAGLLMDTELAAEQREYAETIRSCADTLLGLINDILDFSKIEAGKLAIELIPFDLEAAAQEAVEPFAAKAAEKHLNLVLRYTPDGPNWLIGDPGRVRQILTNLVNNAIKFTEAGHVFVNIECERFEGATAWMRFAVEDSGIGIPPDQQPQVFERFTQADTSTTRKYGGTGLGLAISRQLVELMGGHMGLHSQVGEGSTFWFALPLSIDPQKRHTAAVTMAALRDVRALIVDDNAVNRRVLHELVTRWGMRNGGFASGAEALEALRAARASGDPFQIAIVDLSMPEMDGETLGRAIKSDLDLRDTVLVLLTSFGQHGDARWTAEAGFAAYLTKPVRSSVLREALTTAWSAQQHQGAVKRISRHAAQRPAASAAPGEDQAFSQTRILVVEDNIVNQKVACISLQRLGCRVDAAANGKEAVEMVQRMAYDIVFMDCQMPVMDGYEATREIRRLEKAGTRIPIVAMTANAMLGDREKCLEVGMDDYVSKPVERHALEDAVKKHVEGKRPPLAKAALEPELEETLKWMREEGGDEFVSDLIGNFLTKAREQISALDGLIAGGDDARVKWIAHDLKGCSAQLGAKKLAECLCVLEAQAASDALPDVSLESLRAEFGRLLEALEGHRAPGHGANGGGH